jgi:tRNA/rRNA methyltransferase
VIGELPFATNLRSERAGQQQMQNFFDALVRELDRVEFLRPQEKRETMLINLRNIFVRMEPTKQDLQTLSGVVAALAEGRKGPAKGGVLDSEDAARLRALLAEHGTGAGPAEGGPMRGLARLLRRNPTDAERALWDALKNDRRFAGQFKRQTPVGKQIPDFVSFPLRLAIEIVSEDENDTTRADRVARRHWLEARDYRVVDVAAADVASALPDVLDRLAGAVQFAPPRE